MKRIVVTGLHAVVIACLFLSTSCQELDLLKAQLDDEVKQANDRYLEVVGTYPEQNDQEINPSAPLWINFDRDINIDKVDGYINIAIQNSYGVTSDFIDDEGGSLIFSFDDTDTLSINTNPFLSGGAKIIVTLVAGLPGADGSVLRDTQSWSFYTGKLPAGTMEIIDGDPPYADAADGYMNSTGNAGVSISVSKEVTHYYISATHDPGGGSPDAVLATESPTTAVTSWEPIDGDSAYTDLSFTVNTGGGDDAVLNLLAADSTAISLPDGSKNLYIRFYDDEEETFSPIVEAVSILDTTDPTVSPYFASSAYTSKGATVRAGASDINGIPTGNYQWESVTAPVGSEIVTFGSPNGSSSSVYVINPDKSPAEIEHEYTLRVTAMDSAGNSNYGDIVQKLDWDRFVTAPTVEIFPDMVSKPDSDLEEALKDTADPTLHLISEHHLVNAYPEYGGIGALSFRWILADSDVPNRDLYYSQLSINDYIVPEKFDEYEFNETDGEYQSPNSKEYFPVVKIYPDGERLLSGYYEYGAVVFDKLENRSERSTNHISFVSDDYLERVLAAMAEKEGAVWPPIKATGINRFPSFCWTKPMEVLAPMIKDYTADPLYYRLRVVTKDDDREIVVEDIDRPYWFNAGPDDFSDLLGRQEVRWWYEIWLDDNVPGNHTDDRVLFTEEDFRNTFKDYYVFATGVY